ncbi:beta-glucoside operon transcriptional antiterminator [Enterococcus sp. DIV2402]|uniref:Beta-glucoside operon transcriptional antiterminator n=1 Tax=Candidatus Enterococcus lowellii TaxID=2230877 RepID=A0ABZ2SNU0_9ENTE|nr:PRD domain-containing protein [Enterococcus sp. DIV2402]MBO0463799.1 PRD domain-containing protein [Enterococcus sp. DIV2402]
MKIKKILNNNSVLVGEGSKDYIWIGTGIGFKTKPGQEADEKKIERVFVLQKQSTKRLMNLLQDMPVEYATLADDIIKYGKQKITYELSDSIYISLTDHLFNTVRLQKEGLHLNNQLFWEIRKFYPNEFLVGEHAVQLINQKFKTTLDDSEASNIAMHFINAQLNSDEQVENIQSLTQKIRDILAIIRMHNHVDVDEKSLSFERFVTHLRFFFKRLETRTTENSSNPLLVHVIEKYPEAYETTLLIGRYLEKELIDEEQLYLTLHVQKLIEK